MPIVDCVKARYVRRVAMIVTLVVPYLHAYTLSILALKVMCIVGTHDIACCST